MGTKWWIAAAAAAALFPSTPSAVSAQAPCSQPYSPFFRTQTYPEQNPIPDLGQSLVVEPSPPDTDGDGAADQFSDNNDLKKLQITRGDGTISLTPGAGHSFVYLGGYSAQPGDLDGDGRDELVIGVDQQGVQYLLPGTTTPGAHTIVDAGILLDGFSNQYQLVGDQNGDHADDLAFRHGNGSEPGWATYSGKDLLEPGPGEVVMAPTPLETYTGSNLVAANLGSGAPTIVTGNRSGNNSLATVHRTPAVQLIVSEFLGEYTGGVGQIGVSDRDGVQFVSIGATDRSGADFAAWNLTDPCARSAQPTAPAVPDPAAPAAALPGQAEYTG